jgi:hypothetical protein
MSGISVQSMFESIKEGLNAEKTGSNAFKDFIKMQVGKTYLGRLVPNIKDPKSTFYHYSHHGFTSLSTGQYVDAMCLKTFGERCPICEQVFKLYKTKNEDDKKLAYSIRSLDKHLVNFYIINDPTTPENEGTVKILRFGKHIHDKILAATEGDDADEFGYKIYDLSENGCNFKIKAESNSDERSKRQFTNYSNSRFTSAGAIPNMTPEKMQEIYTTSFDLTKVLDVKSAEEMIKMLKVHVFCEGASAPDKNKESDSNSSSKEESKKEDAKKDESKKDESKKEDSKKEDSKKEEAKDTPAEGKKAGSDTNDKIKKLLDGLDNL